MACGLPVIASPVGINSDIVDRGENGFLASTPQEWEAAITILEGDSGLRRAMGAAGRRKIERAIRSRCTARALSGCCTR
jgi:glycosyltransferase involved in cell wall biosynthesis